MADNLDLPQVSSSQDQKEVTINDAIGQLSGALDDYLAISTGNANYTLTLTDFQQYMGFRVSGNTVTHDFNLPTGTTKRTLFMVMNVSAATLNVKLGTATFTLAVGTSTNPTVAFFQTDGTANGLFLLTPAAGSAPSSELDLPINFSGKPAAAQQVNIALNRKVTLPIGLTGTQFYCGTNPTSTMTFTISQNGSSIGTIVIGTGGAFTVTFTSLITFSIADVIQVAAPGSQDATGADICINFAFTLV